MSCTFRIAEVCRHPRLERRQVNDDVCAVCPKYAGPDRGLGDKVARLAEATGIAAVARTVERVTGRPCGCAARRAALNKLSTPKTA
jgi:hypothetical protein